MILRSYRSTWPPRRLPSRVRLARFLVARALSAGPRPARILLPVARRLALWTAWLSVTGLVLLANDVRR